MARNEMQNVLELVKDADKYKKEIETLTKLKKSVSEAQKAAALMMKDAQRQLDSARAEADVIISDAKKRAESFERSVQERLDKAKESEAEARAAKDKASRAEIIAKDATQRMRVERDGFIADREEFKQRVQKFEAAVKRLCETA